MSEGISTLLGGPQQMSLGERAALEGVLYAVKPQLAIEIGTAEGGSLRRIAEHSAEVHSFDLVEPEPEIAAIPHATFHSGDSHRLLPEFLGRLAGEGRQVDFVLVDGDHSAQGVRRDAEDLLASPAIAKTVIVFHDTANEEVRRGIDAVDFEAHEKVVHVEPDFVAGSLFSAPELEGELWGGLGLVLVDAGSPRAAGAPAIQQRIVPTARVLREARDRGMRSPAQRLRAAVRARLPGR